MNNLRNVLNSFSLSNLSNNTIFNTIASDSDIDKFLYLGIYLAIIYSTYTIGHFLDKGGKISILDEKLYKNLIMIFLCFSLLYFYSGSIDLFKNKSYQILLLTGILMIMHPFISKETKGSGYDWISLTDMLFKRPISFVYIFIFGYILIFNILLSGYNHRYSVALAGIFLYLLSGYILNKKVSLWFLSLLPLMPITFELRHSMITFLLYPLILSYIIYSGYNVDFEFYKE
jgi:hypothetical protein